MRSNTGLTPRQRAEVYWRPGAWLIELVRLFVLLMLLSFVATCGQKGPLTLPAEREESGPAYAMLPADLATGAAVTTARETR